MTTPMLWVLGSTLFLVAVAGLMKLWQLAKIEDAKQDENPYDAAIRADLARRRRINREQIAQQEKGR